MFLSIYLLVKYSNSHVIFKSSPDNLVQSTPQGACMYSTELGSGYGNCSLISFEQLLVTKMHRMGSKILSCST